MMTGATGFCFLFLDFLDFHLLVLIDLDGFHCAPGGFDSATWPACFKPCGVPRRYRGQMLRESQPRSEIINFLNQKSHINGFSPLLAKVSSRIDPIVRTKHFTACVRLPSHCYTKQQDSHLRAVLSGSFKVRLGAHGRFHPASGPDPRFPDGCLEFKLSTVGVLVSGFSSLSRALARLPELCGQKSFK